MAGLIDTLLVLVHVPAGAVAVASGAAAMLAGKGGRLHRRGGRIYLAAIAGLAAGGYTARRRTSPVVHLFAMGMSYVGLLTAFYVDNGPKLPGWNLLPPISFWVLPTLIGAPLIAFGLRRNARHAASPGPRGD